MHQWSNHFKLFACWRSGCFFLSLHQRSERKRETNRDVWCYSQYFSFIKFLSWWNKLPNTLCPFQFPSRSSRAPLTFTYLTLPLFRLLLKLLLLSSLNWCLNSELVLTLLPSSLLESRKSIAIYCYIWSLLWCVCCGCGGIWWHSDHAWVSK